MDFILCIVGGVWREENFLLGRGEILIKLLFILSGLGCWVIILGLFKII